MAQKYGVTPWGQWFIEVLDSYSMGPRLERGKSYANTGKVTGLTVEGRTVTAKVKGHSSPYYTVKILFPPFPAQEEVFDLIEKDPLLLPRIAAGELPPELLKSLRTRHLSLIPEHWDDMKRSCSCPDWGDPCKHMAAVYYILARQIDADPHLLFQLRGIDLVSRFGSSVIHELEPPFRLSFDAEGDAVRAIPPEAPDPFPEGGYGTFVQSILPSKPPFSDRDFSLLLLEFYHHAARYPLEGIDENEGVERSFAHGKWTLRLDALEPGAVPRLQFASVVGSEKSLGLSEAAALFLSFSDDQGSPEYRFLFYFFRLMRSLWNTGAYAPIPWVQSKSLFILWRPLDTLPAVRDALGQLSLYEPGLLTGSGRSRKIVSARGVVDLLTNAFLTERARGIRFSVSGGEETFRNLLALFFYGESIRVDSPALQSLPLAIDTWLSVLRTDFTAWKYRCTLRGAKPTSSDQGYVVRSFKLFFDVLVDGKMLPLKTAATGSREVLRAPAALASYLPEIRSLSTHPSVVLDEGRLAAFLDEAGPLLSRLGVQVVLPKELLRELKPRLVLRDTKRKAGSLVSYLNLENLVSYEWAVAVGDRVLDLREFEALVAEKSALVHFKEGFVRLDPEKIALLLKKARSPARVSAADILQAQFSGNAALSQDLSRSIDALLEEKKYPPPSNLSAKLRPYQRRGYNWICSLLSAGFGCILADDMGLGKTVQAIAVLLRLEEDNSLGEGGTLIVAPAALLTNWERELGRFAPSISVSRYHGAGRSLGTKSRVFLTTYQTAVRDAEKLASRNFSLLIADEAHIMKNSETAASKTIKSLPVAYRLALSGTPVENRLEDLRSLFDFIIPGYLGSPEAFKKEYRVPIEVDRHRETAEKLKSITAPFLLRRLKTDRSVISELPEKVTINEYASLEKGQAALYESVVREALRQSEGLPGGRDRSALILKLLTSLKQICDHPRCFDKESPPISSLSGKSQLLLTLLEEILRSGERVLIFSQYVETLEILKTIITEELEEAVLLYHGGLGQKKREEMIDAFQNGQAAQIMLISLKAGGLGLNLTAASRVIHYDLWYNPAVENQATDRAFRIGQGSNVFVHRFVTQNTFEEKIEAMLNSKRELAEMTVSSGESWLSRMDHEELRALFSGKV